MATYVPFYRTSLELVTDFGSQFVNDLLIHLHNETVIKPHTTIPYSKEENGIVEQANKEVNRHIWNIFFDFALAKTGHGYCVRQNGCATIPWNNHSGLHQIYYYCGVSPLNPEVD